MSSASYTANNEALAARRFDHLVSLFGDLTESFATGSGTKTEDLLDPDIVCEAMIATESPEKNAVKDEYIAQLKHQLAEMANELNEKDEIIAARDDSLYKKGNIIAAMKKTIAAQDHFRQGDTMQLNVLRVSLDLLAIE
jgi:hypothetical protein